MITKAGGKEGTYWLERLEENGGKCLLGIPDFLIKYSRNGRIYGKFLEVDVVEITC